MASDPAYPLPPEGSNWFAQNAPTTGSDPGTGGLQNVTGAAPPPPLPSGGGSGISSLDEILNSPLLEGFKVKFEAPTELTEKKDPGFKARLAMGQRALQSSAAARGTLLTGGTLKALNQFAQDYASNEYANVFNRALQQYQLAYNVFANNQANQFNRLFSVSGLGANAAAGLGGLNPPSSNTLGGLFLTQGKNAADTTTSAANSTGAGEVAGSNALNNALAGIGGNASQLALLIAALRGNPSVGPFGLQSGVGGPVTNPN